MMRTTSVFIARCVAVLGLLLASTNVIAAAGPDTAHKAPVDLSDKQSLQRGAGLFANYCISCHSAKFMRYERMALDIGIPEKVLRENFMFGTDKPGDTMTIAMPAAAAESWFGVTPPDLSLTARSRGADWIYSYLLGYYHDPERPTGTNNLQYPDTAMPHVLWELQGLPEPVMDADGKRVVGVTAGIPGKLSENEYTESVADIVNYMVYIAEPAQFKRTKVGFWVIFYLLIFLVVVYLLKREYWKDIH